MTRKKGKERERDRINTVRVAKRVQIHNLARDAFRSARSSASQISHTLPSVMAGLLVPKKLMTKEGMEPPASQWVTKET